jgi:3-hydroxyacyl-[acyl-carrier-protein] dehydratase
MANDLNPEILSTLKTILRRDLKLGPDAVIADDMPFFGGNIDLDSLDMLLLVTSLEKQFGIKVPNEAVGKEVFQNLTTLATYVQQQKQSPATAVAGNAAKTDWLAKLPHGENFRFITDVYTVTPGQSATGYWRLTGAESFFTGHFPGRPIVPGVLIAEALAQLSGFTAPEGTPSAGKLAAVDIRFEQPIAPPVQIELQSTLLRMMGDLQLCDVIAKVGDQIAARGMITLLRTNS